MVLPTDVDVVVVGAGPAGLTLAGVLRKAGIDVAVFDQVAEGQNTSRAAVIHARTLEVLDELDVTPRLLAEGIVVPVFTIRDRDRLLARLDFSGLPTPYPYTLMLSQSRTESILNERLGELGGCVRRPWTATGLESTPDGASVTVVDTAGGTPQIVRARYVVGADGLHSTVRETSGIGFTGGHYDASFVLADVELTWPLAPQEVQLFLASDGLVVVAPLPGGHHRIVATVAEAPERPGIDLVARLLTDRGPGGVSVRGLVWSSRFRVQHRVADHYRAGPFFLAGDAAHVHSPAGGQGMNTGIQDAVDLGHTLTEVLRGRRDEASLDGYEARRRPVAQQVVRLTDRATRMATVSGRIPRATRNLLLSAAARIPRVRRQLALQIAELPPSTRGGATSRVVRYHPEDFEDGRHDDNA